MVSCDDDIGRVVGCAGAGIVDVTVGSMRMCCNLCCCGLFTVIGDIYGVDG